MHQSFFLLLWALLIPAFVLGQNTAGNQTLAIGKTSIIKSVNDPNLCLYPKDGSVAFSMQTYDNWIDQGILFNENGSIALANNPNKCIDLFGGSTKSGTRLIVMTCNDSQSPKWYYNETDQTIRLQSNSNKCIQGEGDMVQLQSCSNSALQQFTIVQPLQIHFAGDFTKCVDIDTVARPSGANIQLYDCKNGADALSQFFMFSQSRIQARISAFDYCLEYQDGNTDNGTNVYLAACNDGNGQTWIYTQTTSGVIQPSSDSTKCMHIKGDFSINGANIQLKDCNNAIRQQFVIR